MNYIEEQLSLVDRNVPVYIRFLGEVSEMPNVFVVIRFNNRALRVNNNFVWNFNLHIYFTDYVDGFAYMDKLNDISVVNQNYDKILVNQFAGLQESEVKEIDIREIGSLNGVSKDYFLWQYPFYIKYKE